MRWNDAVMPVVKLAYYELGTGLTCNVNISKLRAATASSGGFKVILSYRNYLNMGNSTGQQVRCLMVFKHLAGHYFKRYGQKNVRKNFRTCFLQVQRLVIAATVFRSF
jgi:hypothetical protein